jgi:hypothetical protein
MSVVLVVPIKNLRPNETFEAFMARTASLTVDEARQFLGIDELADGVISIQPGMAPTDHPLTIAMCEWDVAHPVKVRGNKYNLAVDLYQMLAVGLLSVATTLRLIDMLGATKGKYWVVVDYEGHVLTWILATPKDASKALRAMERSLSQFDPAPDQ